MPVSKKRVKKVKKNKKRQIKKEDKQILFKCSGCGIEVTGKTCVLRQIKPPYMAAEKAKPHNNADANALLY